MSPIPACSYPDVFSDLLNGNRHAYGILDKGDGTWYNAPGQKGDLGQPPVMKAQRIQKFRCLCASVVSKFDAFMPP